jgi:hypothetical protein
VGCRSRTRCPPHSHRRGWGAPIRCTPPRSPHHHTFVSYSACCCPAGVPAPVSEAMSISSRMAWSSCMSIRSADGRGHHQSWGAPRGRLSLQQVPTLPSVCCTR